MLADNLPNFKNSGTVYANAPSEDSEELSMKRNERQAKVRFIFVLTIQALDSLHLSPSSRKLLHY